jgi:hypothetical protein
MKTPVTSFELYLSKLHPDNSNLWQRPKKAEHVSEVLWYDNLAVGKNTSGNIKPYTIHCIRATCIRQQPFSYLGGGWDFFEKIF